MGKNEDDKGSGLTKTNMGRFTQLGITIQKAAGDLWVCAELHCVCEIWWIWCVNCYIVTYLCFRNSCNCMHTPCRMHRHCTHVCKTNTLHTCMSFASIQWLNSPNTFDNRNTEHGNPEPQACDTTYILQWTQDQQSIHKQDQFSDPRATHLGQRSTTKCLQLINSSTKSTMKTMIAHLCIAGAMSIVPS